MSGPQLPFTAPEAPSLHFNGITVGSSFRASQPDPFPYRATAAANSSNNGANALNGRTIIDLVAPGVGVTTSDTNTTLNTNTTGTSFAAPHVTATVALLQEHAVNRFAAGDPLWQNGINLTARRHQVMKAVLMNSADKYLPFGTVTALGMTRDVLNESGNTWLNSPARNDPTIPLDPDFGAGHLNARRALEQFSFPHQGNIGPTRTTAAALIGWDVSISPGAFPGDPPSITKYVLDTPITADGTIAATLIWDREPVLIEDTTGFINGRFDATFDTTTGLVDFEEQFFEPLFEQETFNEMDLYLLPAGATDINQAVAASESTVMNTEHIFFDVATAGSYEIWVVQRDNFIGTTGDQLYALAWWADTGVAAPTTGDYDGSGVIDAGDYAKWAEDFGSTVAAGTGADGNGDTIVSAADYTIWRDVVPAPPAFSAAVVPEPTSSILLFAACGFVLFRHRQQRPDQIRLETPSRNQQVPEQD